MKGLLATILNLYMFLRIVIEQLSIQTLFFVMQESDRFDKKLDVVAPPPPLIHFVF